MTGILKKIRRGQEPRTDRSHVVIEPDGRRAYRVSGSSLESDPPSRLTSEGFTDFNEAVVAAMDWAATNKIEYVHVVAFEP